MTALSIKHMCRICSGTGLYDIHSQIPFYLHSSPNEFSRWVKTIAELITEITGDEVTKEDGMPQKICTICISYLKHASTFRQQAINNIQNLKISKGLLTKPVDVLCDTPEIVEKFTSNNINVNKETYDYLKQELDSFFDDNNEDNSDDEEEQIDNEPQFNGISNRLTKTDIVKTAIQNFFNYSEKPFEEDDLSDFGLNSISINIPEEFRERKCYSCNRRFMLNDSYESHLKECIQTKLISFITDCQQLLIIKKHRAISTQEFVRRMIFSLKTIVKSLALCYKYVALPLSTNANNELKQIDKCMVKKTFQTVAQNFVQSTKLKPVHTVGISLFNADSITNESHKPTVQLNTKIPNFVAKCPSCKQTFDSLHALETHNREFHNAESVSSDNASSEHCESDLFRQLLMQDTDYNHEGIVDVLKLRQKSPKI